MQIFICVSFALYYNISEMSTIDLCRFEQLLCLVTHNIMRLICQTDHFFFALFGVFYRLIRPSASALHIAYHKIRTVDHDPVPYLYRSFRVRMCRLSAYLNFVVVVQKLSLVLSVFCPHIRQNKRKMRVSAAVAVYGSPYGSSRKQVKFSVTTYQKFNVFFLRYDVVQKCVQLCFYVCTAFNAPVSEKTYRVNVKQTTSTFLLLPYLFKKVPI